MEILSRLLLPFAANLRMPVGQDSTSGFRDSGAIDKGISDVVGRGGAVIGCVHICHY
jgi:hypothetical protein